MAGVESATASRISASSRCRIRPWNSSLGALTVRGVNVLQTTSFQNSIRLPPVTPSVLNDLTDPGIPQRSGTFTEDLQPSFDRPYGIVKGGHYLRNDGARAARQPYTSLSSKPRSNLRSAGESLLPIIFSCGDMRLRNVLSIASPWGFWRWVLLRLSSGECSRRICPRSTARGQPRRD